MSGPSNICHTKTRPRNIPSKEEEKKVSSKANFRSVFENYIHQDEKHTFSLCFELAQ